MIRLHIDEQGDRKIIIKKSKKHDRKGLVRFFRKLDLIICRLRISICGNHYILLLL